MAETDAAWPAGRPTRPGFSQARSPGDPYPVQAGLGAGPRLEGLRIHRRMPSGRAQGPSSLAITRRARDTGGVTHPHAAPRRVLETSPFSRPEVLVRPPGEFAVGDRVTHDRYGLGRVVSVDTADYLCLDFGAGGIKQFAGADPSLTKL